MAEKNDIGGETVSTSEKITLNMLWNEIQKMNQTLIILKEDIEELKNTVSHISGHIEEEQTQ